MPYTATQPALPWHGKTVTTRHTSHQAAVSASATRGHKSDRYLAWLASVPLATDWGAAEHFGWPLSSICSIRNGLVDRGLVEVAGTCQGRYGKTVALWRVRTEAG